MIENPLPFLCVTGSTRALRRHAPPRPAHAVRHPYQVLHRAQAVAEFDLHGTILNANARFLGLLGYVLAEVQGRHHGMFIDEELRNSTAHQNFWNQLAGGHRFQAAPHKHLDKQGRAVWLQASYNPLFDDAGAPHHVISFATAITHLNRFTTQEAQS